MPDQQEWGPFSREKAWLTYRENMAEAARLKKKIAQEREEGTASEREMLEQAVEALGRLTDNTILAGVVKKALEARKAE